MKKILKCAAALSVAAALSAGCFAACSDSPSEPEIERVDDTRTLTDNEYTVLNLSGTDALGRTFTTADSENGELYVGMFYFLWLGQHGSEMNGIYDVTDITENGENMDAFYYTNSEESPLNKYHFWGEPVWGYYQSDDEWVIRKQVEMLTMAGIDYLFFDTTNGPLYDNVTAVLFEVLREYYDAGWDVPKIMYYVASGDKENIITLYENFYSQGEYEDLWFAPDDKPIITVMNSTTWDETDATEKAISEFFDFRYRQWPTESFLREGWPWMEFEYPQPIHTDVVNVSAAQHTSVKMSETTANRGKGFDITTMQNDSSKVAEGSNYESQWERVLTGENSDMIRFVNVTGWNEWVALKLDDAADRYFMVDQFNEEYSRDLEPVKGESGDNYYMQTIQNIREWKYSDPVHYNYVASTIDVTSFNADAWENASTYLDFTGECIERDHAAFDGSFNYIDTSNRNDIASVSVTHDDEYVYFRVETLGDITAYESGDDGWMNIFVKTNSGWSNSFMGYQYAINRSVNGNETSVSRYTSGGTWEEVGTGDVYVSGNVMQVRVRLADLGMSASDYYMEFKVTDNIQSESDPLSFFSTGDAAPIGRLSYTYGY